MLQFCLKYIKCCSLSSEGHFMLSEAKGRMFPARPYKAHNWATAGLVSFSHLKGRTWDINHFPNVWSDVSLPVLKLAVSPSQNQVKDHLQNRAGHTSSSSLSQMKGTTTERISDLLELFCSCFSVYSYLVKNTNTVKLCMKSELRVFLSVKEIKRYQHPSWRLGVK